LGKPDKIRGSQIKTPLPLGYLSRSLPNLILSKNSWACLPNQPVYLSTPRLAQPKASLYILGNYKEIYRLEKANRILYIYARNKPLSHSHSTKKSPS